MIKPIKAYRPGAGYFKSILKASVTPFQARDTSARLLGLSVTPARFRTSLRHLPFRFHYLIDSAHGFTPNLVMPEGRAFAASNFTDSYADRKTPLSNRDAPVPSQQTTTPHTHENKAPLTHLHKEVSLPQVDDVEETIRQKLAGLDVRKLILDYQARFQHTKGEKPNVIQGLAQQLERQNFQRDKPPVKESREASPSSTQNDLAPSAVKQPGVSAPAKPIITATNHVLPGLTQKTPTGQRDIPEDARATNMAIRPQQTQAAPVPEQSATLTALSNELKRTSQAGAIAPSSPQSLPYVKPRSPEKAAGESGAIREADRGRVVKQARDKVEHKAPRIKVLETRSPPVTAGGDDGDFFTRSHLGHSDLIFYK
ncbi:MAG: hypothetical protein GC149_14200 [Gammaproteobacteria bacterium]|nr:hypothetical protein [Gammaproteobacteria bacterium]